MAHGTSHTSIPSHNTLATSKAFCFYWADSEKGCTGELLNCLVIDCIHTSHAHAFILNERTLTMEKRTMFTYA